jgi:hypothetical protein
MLRISIPGRLVSICGSIKSDVYCRHTDHVVEGIVQSGKRASVRCRSDLDQIQWSCRVRTCCEERQEESASNQHRQIDRQRGNDGCEAYTKTPEKYVPSAPVPIC